MPGEGRPTKLTPETQALMIESIQMGLPVRLACKRAGISHTAHYQWIKRGREEGEGLYADYVDAIEKAEAEGIFVRLVRLDMAAEAGSWRADTWYLERCYPEYFARLDRHEITGADGGPVRTAGEVTVNIEPGPDAIEALAILRDVGAIDEGAAGDDSEGSDAEMD